MFAVLPSVVRTAPSGASGNVPEVEVAPLRGPRTARTDVLAVRTAMLAPTALHGIAPFAPVQNVKVRPPVLYTYGS
ncbi:hypothetical protein GCM10022206_60880 [Streptomyces chiangmaiensis]